MLQEFTVTKRVKNKTLKTDAAHLALNKAIKAENDLLNNG